LRSLLPDPAPTPFSPLSLHDALPISDRRWPPRLQDGHGGPPRPGRRDAGTVALADTDAIVAGRFHLRVRPRRWRYSAHPQLHVRSEEHTSELQSLTNLVCRLLLSKKN